MAANQQPGGMHFRMREAVSALQAGDTSVENLVLGSMAQLSQVPGVVYHGTPVRVDGRVAAVLCCFTLGVEVAEAQKADLAETAERLGALLPPP